MSCDHFSLRQIGRSIYRTLNSLIIFSLILVQFSPARLPSGSSAFAKGNSSGQTNILTVESNRLVERNREELASLESENHQSVSNDFQSGSNTFYAASVVGTGHTGSDPAEVTGQNAILGPIDDIGAKLHAAGYALCPALSALYIDVDLNAVVSMDGSADNGNLSVRYKANTALASLKISVSEDYKTWRYVAGDVRKIGIIDWTIINVNYTGRVRFVKVEAVRENGSCFGEVNWEVDSIQVKGTPLSIPIRSMFSQNSVKNGSKDSRGCSLCTIGSSYRSAGDPINTKTGSFDYGNNDLSVNTVAGPLSFQRSYASGAVELYSTAPLGPGWTHNHDIYLVKPTTVPGGEAGTVWFKGSDAAQLKFFASNSSGDGPYTPYPGVSADLIKNADGTYQLTTADQSTYLFNSAGWVTEWKNATGKGFTYSYDANGRLEWVYGPGETDNPDIQRSLHFQYYENGKNQIQSVSDDQGRSVLFTYDPTTDDLLTYTDVQQQMWRYSYSTDFSHHLEKVITQVSAPTSRDVTVVNTEYDTEGRAYKQKDALDNPVLEITYNSDGTATIKDGYGNSRIDTYDGRNTSTGQTDPNGKVTQASYEANFRPASMTDPFGRETKLGWTLNGVGLSQVQDAAGNITSMDYNSLNNLTKIVEPNQGITEFTYDTNHPTLLLYSTQQIGSQNLVTTYTYTTSADFPQPENLLKTVTDPLDHTTTYAYNSAGQLISVENALHQITSYTYDAFGNVQKITDPRGRKDWMCYDDGRHLIRTVANASYDEDPEHPNPCSTDYPVSADPDKDHITDFVYDVFGNQIATTVHGNQKNITTRAYFDDNQRPVTIVSNLMGQGIEVSTPPVRNADLPDQNVRIDYDYDLNGNQIAVTDPSGKVSRIYYDVLNRPEVVIQNLVGWDKLDRQVPTCVDVSCTEDQNVYIRYHYDDVGDRIAVTDARGFVTRTYYDAIHRPIVAVQNLTNWELETRTPPVCSPQVPCDDTANIRTDFYYDGNGNQIATLDPLGVVTRTYYDVLNRPIKFVRNLVNPSITNVSVLINANDAPAYDPINTPDHNVPTTFSYDNAGNRETQTDARGFVTRYEYDELNRLRAAVQNYLADPGADPDPNSTNVRTEYTYDANGNLETICPRTE